MNIYFIQIINKWISIMLISGISILGNFNYVNKQYSTVSRFSSSESNMVGEVLKYETVTKYVSNRPLGIALTVSDGKNGYAYIDKVTGKQVVLEEKIDRIVEVGSGKVGEYTGTLTGYGPDCPGCSKVGNVACATYERKQHSLINSGIYYNDREYGSVRILAADFREFPCGTMVYVDNGILEPFYGIVLDTGITMRNAYSEGKIWMDLAFPTESIALTSGATSKNTKFSVVRWGW